jgi:predicted transcriptional regulator
VNTIDGAVGALTNGDADYFMWERFMTKPLVDNGTFRRVGDCPTPWPCFVIAVRDNFLSEHSEIIATVLCEINQVTTNFKQIPHIENRLAKDFNQKQEDISEWLSLTEWSQKSLDEDLLNKVQNQLLDCSVIHKKGTFADMARVF